MSFLRSFATPPFRNAAAMSLALLFGAGVACGDNDPVSPLVVALDQAEARWSQSKPASGKYSFDQQVMCFCPYGATTFRVTVAGGVITRVQDPQALTDLPPHQFQTFRTVEQLFGEVRSALARSGVLTTVEYDPTMGFPSMVSLDPIRNAVDDEVAYVTKSFLASP